MFVVKFFSDITALLREELHKENELNTTPIYDEIDKGISLNSGLYLA